MPDRSESPSTHVDDETFERYACGELTAADRARVDQHAATCEECARVLRGLGMLQREAARFDVEVPGAAKMPAWRGPVAMGIAAALAIAIVGGVAWTVLYNANATSTVREAQTSTIEAIAPRGRVTVAPTRFEWRAWDGATRYEVRLFKSDGTLVWSGSTDSTAIQLPSSVALDSGQYYWQVSSSRGAPAASALVPFTVDGR